MNEKLLNNHSPIQRILTIFDDLPTIQSIVVLGSFTVPRLMDGDSKPLAVDARELFGPQLWRDFRNGALDGLSIRFSRQQAPTQLFEFFGPHEVSRYERAQLELSPSKAITPRQTEWL